MDYIDYFHGIRDVRVDNWLFMSSPLPTLLICLSYVLIVKYFGPKFMENRPAYDLRHVLVFYNAFQVLFSGWLFYEYGRGGWFHGYSFTCQPVDYSENEMAMRMVHACWWYYFSKYTEFFDTFFFVLRKKRSQITSLHVIHHGLMPMSVWFGVKYTPGGHSTFFGLLNTLVHVFMYVYYMVSAMGPQWQRYIWWKKHITTIQMVQFVLIAGHAFQLLFTSCNYPRGFVWWIGSHGLLFLILFANFYRESYQRNYRDRLAQAAAKFVNGTSGGDWSYTFRHWLQTDIFVYFSHNFVTVPPLGWINAAHLHGVQILGTIITEWTEGEALCAQFLKDSSTMDQVVDKLVAIVSDFGFDGYLLNIENKLEGGGEKLVEFMEKLNRKLKATRPSHLLIHYDSVLLDGTLKWQNELNPLNKPFFTASDGIFLNYNWTDETLQRSAEMGQVDNRKSDVFVGVDVFGRGCYGGGGLNMSKALEKIAEHGLSAAIFAPGWSYECHSKEAFEGMDNQLWDRATPWFSYRSWKGTPMSIQEGPPSPKSRMIFSTDFSRGFGKDANGLQGEGDWWFDLSKTSFQPILLHKYGECPPDDLDIPPCPLDEEKEVKLLDTPGNYPLDSDSNPDKMPPPPPPPPNQKLAPVINWTEFDTSCPGFLGNGGCLNVIYQEMAGVPYNFLYLPLDISCSGGSKFAILVVCKSMDSERKEGIDGNKLCVSLEVEVAGEHDEVQVIHLENTTADRHDSRIDNLKLFDFVKNQANPNNTEYDIPLFSNNGIGQTQFQGWDLLCYPLEPKSIGNVNGLRLAVTVTTSGEPTSPLLLGFLSLIEIVN